MNKKRIGEMVAEIKAAKSIYHLGGSIECPFSSIGNKEDIPLITNYMQELNCSRSYVQHDSMEYLMFFIDKDRYGKIKWGIYTIRCMEV
jgi:hypothetical protein